jgi:NADPH-dependent ferric siderophore reductase
MNKPSRGAPPRQLVVREIVDLTPHMRRIRLGGQDLADFPEGQESGYVKLVLEHEGEIVRRTYTVRNFDLASQLLDIDFMLHGDEGPASAWAARVRVGDRIPVGGPGPVKLVDFSADWFLLAGDMTALPAISVNIEKLPADARGYLIVEIIDPQDKQDLPLPPGMEAHWVVNPVPSETEFPLLDRLRELPILPGRPSIWVAGEFHTSRAIRRYLKQECGIERQDLYASSYWHIGLSEDRHKQVKAADTDA